MKNIKKLIVPLLLSMVLLTGCIQQSTTVTINQDASATVEQKLNTGTSMDTSGVVADIEKQFIEKIKKQNPVSLLRYNDNGSGGIVGKYYVSDIVSKDVFASEKFFIPNDKKNVVCNKRKNLTVCTADFNVEIKSPELEQVLQQNGLTYDNLDPYILTLILPTKAKESNAAFFDLEQNKYIWEIPVGKKVPVFIKFEF